MEAQDEMLREMEWEAARQCRDNRRRLKDLDFSAICLFLKISTMRVQQQSTLFAAIRFNDIQLIKAVLASEHYPRLLSAGDLGFHLLRKSIERNRTEITRLLLDHGCSAALSSFTGESPLHLAVTRKRNCRGLVKRLLENGARIEHRNRRNETALHAAFSASADDEVIQLLLEEHLKKSVLNEKNEDGLNYLHIACATADMECVRKFVEQGGADINAQVKTDCASPYAGSTPLHMAVEFGRFEVIEYLLVREASIHVPDRAGSTPIHVALELGETDIIELLFEYDDERLNCVNNFGVSHFMASCACNTPEFAQDFLIDRFSGDGFLNVNEVVEGGDSDYMLKGFTPLHFAAIFGQSDTVKYLLHQGANCCAVTRNQITPAQFADRNGFDDVRDVIEAHCRGYERLARK